MDEVATQHTNIVRNETIVTGGEQPSSAKDGKKRARKEMDPTKERKTKRVKVEGGPSDNHKTVKISIKKAPKPKVKGGQAQSQAAGSKANSTTFTKLRWSVFRPFKTPILPEPTKSQGLPLLTKLKPRIWTSSREELIALLPDLAGPKCLNGVSWLMYETPMVLLDDSAICFDISLQQDSITLDLLTTREFTCIWPPRPEKAPDPLENLTVNGVSDGNLSNLAMFNSISKMVPESTKDFKVTVPEQSVTPSVSTNSPAVESIDEPSEISKRIPSGPFSDMVMKRGRKIKAETSDGLINFSVPSIPSYPPTAGGFSEPLQDVYPNKGIGNTATKYQHKASSNSTTKFREQNHSTHALMSTGPPQGREFVNGRSNDPLDHQSQFQGHGVDQVELLKNSPPTYTTSIRPDKRASSIDPQGLIEPLSHQSLPYETKYAVTTDMTYTTSDSVDKLLTEAVDTFGLDHSPSSSDVEPDAFESSTRTAAIPLEEDVRTQQLSVNIALNTGGPAPQIQSASSNGMTLIPLSAVPNNQIAVTNNQHEPDLDERHSPELSQPTSSANRCDNPLKQTTTSSSEVVKALYPTTIPFSFSSSSSHAEYSRQTQIPNTPHTVVFIPTGETRQVIGDNSKGGDVPSHPGFHGSSRVNSKPEIALQTTAIVGPTNYAPNEDTVERIRIVKAQQDAFIPSAIPEEIQAIIDSYLSGRPVLLVISNQRFFDCWSLRLPEEFGFSMLGYFRILGVQESRVHLSDPECPLKDSSGSIAGRVKWCFRLQWSPGGEEWILPKHDKDLLEHPWWKPPPPLSTQPLKAPRIRSSGTRRIDHLTISQAALGLSQKIPGTESTSAKDRAAPFELESTFDTTPRYRAARLSNVNYEFRHNHFRELYHSHVPLQLLAPYGHQVLDSAFPRGWLCETCGKMNFQAALRHRMCSSSFCKGLKPEIAPYAIELTFMRDPQDKLSMVLPYNEPLLINLVDTWEDGTQTLPYYIHDDKNIFIKHIFTRNLPPLQLEATRLLHFIQIEVELVRPIGGNSPYFQYSAHAPKDDPSPTTSEWPNVPLCIHHAKDWTQHQAEWFGELKEGQLLINHLCLLAWVTSGIKRGPTIIRAKEKCVVFHAFGCNITVLVTPLSSKVTLPVKSEGAHLDSLISMDDLPLDEPDVNPGWIASLDEEDDVVEDPLQEDKERWPGINSKKASDSKYPFLFTLVHGDVLVFYGDDFEYSLKRAGTSFLLIASHQNEPQE